jgi:hypothetical protein
MKKLSLLLILLSFVIQVNAQNDTLLYENFDVDPTAAYLPFNSGSDLDWVNFDADGLSDANNRPQQWFWSDAGFATIDENDGCLFSSSWLTGFLPGNRNWLMTPPLNIVDASAVLSWAAAPRQTPRYVDGYTVLVSTTDNIESSFTNVLFEAGQYLSGAGSDYAAYTFSPGFVHGQDGTYIEFDTDSAAFLGEQRPFSVSLAQFSGQTIYIAFLHDADDDNLISLDDILVTGTLTGLNESQADFSLNVSPNPTTDKISLSYSLNKTGAVAVEVFDAKGSKVISLNKGLQIAGAQKLAIDVKDLANGLYNVILYASGKSYSTKFVKE